MTDAFRSALGAGDEFDAIRAIVAGYGDVARDIGDDAAIVTVPRGDGLVVSVDASIEGRHFRRGWLTPREIGARAVTAALSDLAAMAAQPLGILVAIALPDAWRSDLDAIAAGAGDAARQVAAGAPRGRHGTPIVGGNLSAADELSLTITVLGHAYAPLERRTLGDGDRLYVTGSLGGPGAAIRALSRGDRPEARARARFASPRARIAEARWLAERGASAAIDISDGLAADLGHLCAASGTRVEVDVEAVPRIEGVDVLDALASGEEYELIVGFPSHVDVDTAEFTRRFGIPLTALGTAARMEGTGEAIFRSRGERVAAPRGHDHLSH